MPRTARSLRITDAYRAQLAGLTRRASHDARRWWRKLDWADLDRSYWTIQSSAFLTIQQAQKEAVRMTSGYLQAYLSSELGQKATPPQIKMADYVGKSFNEKDLLESLRSPLIKVKVANKEGQPDPMGTGLKALLAAIDIDVKNAARTALRDMMDRDERIVGWKRAVKGTCEACAGAADGSTLPAGTELDIHPNCECVSEAQVQSREPTSLQQEAIQWYETGYGVNDMTALRAADGDITKLSEEAQARVRNLTSVIAENAEDAPTLYRTVDNAKLPSEIRTALFGRGREFRDWGLSAASANSGFPLTWIRSMAEVGNPIKKPVILKINGAKGLNVEKLARRLGWAVDSGSGAGVDIREWWLRPGTKYKVTSSRKTTRGLEVNVDVVG